MIELITTSIHICNINCEEILLNSEESINKVIIPLDRFKNSFLTIHIYIYIIYVNYNLPPNQI